MSREWKPGDVAMAKRPIVDGEVRGIIDTDGRFYTTDQSCAGMSSSTFAVGNLRPVAVIDPEDRREIQGLLVAFCRAADVSIPTILGTDAMQAALREFANPTPPTPDEPQGLGAVVEAIYDNRFIRVGAAGWVHEDNSSGDPCDWDDIAVVRVLSEGVTA